MEWIIDEQDWIPGVILPTTRRVQLRVGFGENDLREKVKAAGGYWDPEKKAWVLAYGKVLELGLERRVLDENPGF